MKKIFYLFSLAIITLACSSCSNDDLEIADDATGIIKFDYQNKSVHFTATTTNLEQEDIYGFSDPSIQWIQMLRLAKTNDFSHKVFIFMSGTDLNSLLLPYTFQSGIVGEDAQINYTVDQRIETDSNGQDFVVTNTYAATTYSNDFTLTILSKEDGVLRGTFEGRIENQDGDSIMVKNGTFDVQIVEK
ncbi:hypothetical protein [Tenacibaculum sp. 190524A05c]|uniref:hypothetical protein n=1 Tax=Tenacibaculum platacis TaxID=3137852 RepID=UPI0032B2ADA8